MSLTIERDVYEEMLLASTRAVPCEACGLLAGEDRRATKCYELTNADNSPEHFSMIPSEQFSAVRDMRSRGLRMLAIWHSHPESPARMSEEDLRLAFTPDVTHVILSLAGQAGPEIRGYQLNDGVPENVAIVITQ